MIDGINVDEFINQFTSSEITSSSEQKLIRTPEAHKKIKKVDMDKMLEAYEDRTHFVVDLAKEEGRNLADDAFSMGYSLDGLYNGEWFYVFFNGDNLQAAYNIRTEELVLSDDMESLSVMDNNPVKP